MARLLRSAASSFGLMTTLSGCLGLLGDFSMADGAAPDDPVVDAAVVDPPPLDAGAFDGSHRDGSGGDGSGGDGSGGDASVMKDAGEAFDASEAAPPLLDSGEDHAVPDCGSAAPSSVDGAVICGCAPGARRACAAGALGCPGGTQECGTGGAWGACTGAADPFDEAWKTDFGAGGSAWNSVFGDPFVDVSSGRLRLSNDDVVDRNVPIPGSYYVTHDLTLSGGTVFTPAIYLDPLESANLPSIRRAAAGSMQFGGDYYAGSWSDTDPAGVAGKSAPGVLTARVTTYVRAQSSQLAMKVEAAGAVYRSGWTAPLTKPKTDVRLFRFVGENNSSVYSGTDDFVYVGALRGCGRMSDSDVEAAYTQ